ncbi:hypothetical protein C0J52_17614 [Blattella germanica]|nr:hypothetical protein C0J52_17614 [Blattella germanica]
MKPYRIQMLQTLKPEDFANFHLSGKVNRHNVRIWGTQQPYVTVQHERDSAKVNVFAAISKLKFYSPFFFAEKTVTGMSFLDMLEQWLLPQLTEDSNIFILQIDGAPPHWHIAVRDYLNTQLPRRWIGRCGESDLPLYQWPPRTPDLTACDFFLWGCIKDKVYIPPLPATLVELKERITHAFTTITRDMLLCVCDEFQYRLDVCRVTKGSHIEHL